MRSVRGQIRDEAEHMWMTAPWNDCDTAIRLNIREVLYYELMKEME